MRTVAAAAAVVVAAAGCAGGNDDKAGAETAGRAAAVAVDHGRAATAPGQTLLRFAAAARRGDVAGMWRLLSADTRATFESETRFRAGGARTLRQSFASLDGEPRLLVSRALAGGRWGVAALAGERIVDGEREDFSYAAALRREARGAWRLELDAVVFDGLEPEPLEAVAARPELAARASVPDAITSVAAWLDGRPVSLVRSERTVFTLRVAAQPSKPLGAGRHDVIVFAASATAAGAVAWPFSVER